MNKDKEKSGTVEKVPETFAEWGEYYAGQKKETILIPVDKQNKDDAVVPVCINGYIYQVQRGKKVEVPESVAGILRNAGYIA